MLLISPHEQDEEKVQFAFTFNAAVNLVDTLVKQLNKHSQKLAAEQKEYRVQCELINEAVTSLSDIQRQLDSISSQIEDLKRQRSSLKIFDFKARRELNRQIRDLQKEAGELLPIQAKYEVLLSDMRISSKAIAERIAKSLEPNVTLHYNNLVVAVGEYNALLPELSERFAETLPEIDVASYAHLEDGVVVVTSQESGLEKIEKDFGPESDSEYDLEDEGYIDDPQDMGEADDPQDMDEVEDPQDRDTTENPEEWE